MLYITIISFTLGIAFEEIFNFGWSAGALVFLISFFIFLYFKRRPLSEEHLQTASVSEGALLLMIGMAFFIGVLRISIVNTSPDTILFQQVDQKVSFEAVISEEADVRDTSTRYVVKPDDLKSQVLLVAERFPKLEYGDKISVSGKLELPKNFTSDSGTEFDYISYLSKDKIHFIIYRPEIEKISSGQGSKLVASLYVLKHALIEKMSAVVPEPNASLLGGLIFGTKQSLGAELLDDFRKVGLIHIVVLSGYNITIIAVGIFYITSWIGKRNVGFIVSAVAIALFAVMVGLGATVIRASIMALIAILARFLGRPAAALRWLFIAGALMLLWNPLSFMHDLSFRLSFMATFGLIIFSPFVYSFISRRNFLSKIIPKNLGLREIVASTIAVQLFITPLLIRMSGEVSIMSFIVNPIGLPFVPYAMLLGALTGSIGHLSFIGEWLSWPFGILSYFITQIIITITELAASLSIASIPIGTLPFLGVLIWYGFYTWVYFRLNNSPPH